jgi:hypothetical protein
VVSVIGKPENIAPETITGSSAHAVPCVVTLTDTTRGKITYLRRRSRSGSLPDAVPAMSGIGRPDPCFIVQHTARKCPHVVLPINQGRLPLAVQVVWQNTSS